MPVTTTGQALCQACRSDLLSLWRAGFAEQTVFLRTTRLQRPLRSPANQPYRRAQSFRTIHVTASRLNLRPDVNGTADLNSHDRGFHPGQGHNGSDDESANTQTLTDGESRHSWKEGLGIDTIVTTVRELHGEYMPADTLTETELARYVRLYGEPIHLEEYGIREDDGELEQDDQEVSTTQLLRNKEDGSLEAVEFDPFDEDADLEQDPAMGEIIEESAEGVQSAHMDAEELKRRGEQIAQELGGIIYQDEQGNAVDEAEVERRRLHHLTIEGQFSAYGRTIYLPKATHTGLVSQVLSEFSNKHITQAANNLFGGPGLPTGVTTPSTKMSEQTPIGVNVTQHTMGEMEANAFVAALWPGIHASVLSVLIEVRKRLGTDWLRKLMNKEGGPRILDAGSGGAAILAWRDIIRAEWQSLYPDEPIEKAPVGKATVLTGADALRRRSAAMLENTTFLPRLPDYVHVRSGETLDDDRPAPQRKQFDIILAPHSLWYLKEDFMRKHLVQNLWTMLSSDGGILVLLEKGVPRGFEVIAGARQMLLSRFISSPGSEMYEDTTESLSSTARFIDKGTGMIIAPCTNHGACPMYGHSGVTQRRDMCTFEQRYIRPSYLQRILNAKSRNHEDIRFSYLAVRKGVDDRQTFGLVQGEAATKAAFEGYERYTEDENVSMLSLPRLVYPPLKRRGHVIMDVCTPEGKAERWTIPKSYSKQAYHDARKSSWGDLWALGAKTRIPRIIRFGKTKLERAQELSQARKERQEDLRWEKRLDEAESELMQEEIRSRGATIDSLMDEDHYIERQTRSLNPNEQLESIFTSLTDMDSEQNALEDDLEDQLDEDEDSDLDFDTAPPEPYSDPLNENWKQWNLEFENDAKTDAAKQKQKGRNPVESKHLRREKKVEGKTDVVKLRKDTGARLGKQKGRRRGIKL